MMAFKQNKLKASVGTPFVMNTNEKRITRNAKRETKELFKKHIIIVL